MTGMLQRLPLVAKMLLITLLAASAVYAGLDAIQARRLRATLHAELQQRLEQQAAEDRYHFHLYVNAHRQAVRLLASQSSFAAYLDREHPFRGAAGPPVLHEEVPPWLPRPSVLRAFVAVRYALLLDPRGRVREVFLGTREPPPPSLLAPSDLLRTLSHNQSIMTALEGRPFLVTSERLAGEDGAPRATLMLATPIDEEFLVRSQTKVGEPRLIALLEGDPPRIVVSSNAAALPPGAPVASVEGGYLLTGKSFFDLASSDLVMTLASFIATSEVDAVMRSILTEGRAGRGLTAAALILVSLLIVLWITLHIRGLSRGIGEFSVRVLGAAAAPAEEGGDEIHLIESRFRRLTEEVRSARERLRAEAEEKLALQAKALAAQRQEEELRLLQALKVSEENYHAIFDGVNDAIFVFDAESGTVLDANPRAERLLGRQRADFVGRHYAEMHPPEQEKACRALFEEAVRTASTISSDLCVLRADGRTVPVEISTSVLERDGSRIALGIFRDVSERRRAERALEEERNRAQMYLDIAAVIIVVIAEGGAIRLINRAGSDILGHPEEEIVGSDMFGRFIPERLREQARETHRRLLAGEEGLARFEFPVLTRSGEERIVAWHNAVVRDEAGAGVASLSSGEDVTDRKRAEEQAGARFRRLNALHSIDLIISSSLDLHVTLEEFLGHVLAQMGADAADVLLLDQYTQTLSFAAGSGFRTEGIKKSSLRLGEGIAGAAALERRSITIPDLANAREPYLRWPLLEGEDFVAYHAVPLTAKGRVQGVLEVFHRASIAFDEEKFGFLEALAAQAAIAIDNATLFDGLQRSNIDLTLAYDATLEGWARALDLRDQVTERHTERVTEMTVRLARALGMREEEIVHVRRGALLHDIGKIGIPDAILRKPGPLTPEEWETMRSHPGLAFEMLRRIAYLKPALDIPYCHHEHWDGSGYPRGLKGEQIPLAARIFALADIWDAIHASDRPYRRALPAAEACEHVRSLAGTHLDPRVVEVFLGMSGEFCRADVPADA